MRQSSFKSLRARLLLLILLATLPALGLILYTGIEHRRQIIDQARAQAILMARYVCGTQRALIDNAHQVLASLAELHEVREMSSERCNSLFARLLKQYPQYINFGASDPKGNLFCSAVPFNSDTRPVSISDYPDFQKSIQSLEFGIGSHQIDPVLKRPTINLAYPALDRSRQVQAVVFASLDLSQFIDLATELKLPKGATLTVRNKEGTIIARYPDPQQWVGRTVCEASVLKAILDNHGEGSAEAAGVDQIERVYAFTMLDKKKESGLYLSVGIPTQFILGESNFELTRNMAGLGLAALLAFMAAWFGGDLFVVRRVRAMVDTARKLKAGELGARISPDGGSYGRDELGELARSLDEMAGSLELGTRQLQQAEAQYRILVEQVPAINYIAALDEVRTTLYMSPQVQIMLGFCAAAWLSEPGMWLKRIHREDRTRVSAELMECCSNLCAIGFYSEYRMLTQDEREVWIRDEARIVRNGSSSRSTLHGIMRDITERKQAEERIRYSENRYRTIFETTGTATIIIEEDTTISLANTEFLKLSGYSKEELENIKSWTEFFTKEDSKRMQEYHWSRRIDPDRAPRNYKARFVDRFGSIRYMFASVSMIPGSAKSVASFLDVSEHKLANDALRESEERYRQFFEEDLTGDFIADSNGHLMAYNAAFTAMFRLDSGDGVRDCSLSSLFRNSDAWNKFLARLDATGKLTYWEEELQGSDGSPVHVIANVIGSFDDSGRLSRMKGYLFDDTSRKKLEEQLRQAQKMEAIGRLAGGVAHDFNNMLTIISGYSEIVLEGLDPDDQLFSYVEEIKKAGERAAGLTRHLLAFSRKQVLQPKVLNLNTAVTNMEKMLRRLIGDDIQLTIILDPQLGYIKADPTQIGQVLMNLAVNARDAMPKGGRLIIETASVSLDEDFTRTHVELKPGRYAMLAVSDNGIGMDAQTQSRIFEPFFTTKEKGKGTGLGLPTVYGIVKQSGGHIYVYSDPHMGTTFKMYLPGVVEGSKEDSSIMPPSLDSGLPHGTETILLVEDDEMVRGTIKKILQRVGYKILEARNGSEALHMQQEIKEPIHLLVSDVIMPLMNGYELAKRLMPLRPDMKVLFVSGYAEEGILDQEILDSGMAFLQKPFTPEHLARKVREVMEG